MITIPKFYIDATNGAEVGYAYRSASPFIPVTPGAAIKFSLIGGTNPVNQGYAFYNDSKVFLRGVVNTDSNYQEACIIVPDDAYYIRITFFSTGNTNFSLFFLHERVDGTVGKIANDVTENSARIAQEGNFQMHLDESDFVSGIIQGSTGNEISEIRGMRSDFIEIVPGCTIQFSVNIGFICAVFTYDEGKNYIWNSNSVQSDTITAQSRAKFIRLSVLWSEGSTRPTFEGAGITVVTSKYYANTRAAAEVQRKRSSRRHAKRWR